MPKFEACSCIVIRKCLNFTRYFSVVCVLVLHVIIAPVKHGQQGNVWKIQIVTRYSTSHPFSPYLVQLE